MRQDYDGRGAHAESNQINSPCLTLRRLSVGECWTWFRKPSKARLGHCSRRCASLVPHCCYLLQRRNAGKGSCDNVIDFFERQWWRCCFLAGLFCQDSCGLWVVVCYSKPGRIDPSHVGPLITRFEDLGKGFPRLWSAANGIARR